MLNKKEVKYLIINFIMSERTTINVTEMPLITCHKNS